MIQGSSTSHICTLIRFQSTKPATNIAGAEFLSSLATVTYQAPVFWPAPGALRAGQASCGLRRAGPTSSLGCGHAGSNGHRLLGESRGEIDINNAQRLAEFASSSDVVLIGPGMLDELSVEELCSNCWKK